MAAIGASLERVITAAAKGTSDIQIGVNKILWGSANTQPANSVKYNPVSGSLTYTTTRPAPSQTQQKGTLLNSGLFNAFDALLDVDLCDIATYLFNQIDVKKRKRPPQDTWTGPEALLYNFQDIAGKVQVAIDKYTAFPTVFVGSFAGTGANPITEQQAISGSGLPPGQDSISGANILKYNIYNLILYIKDSFQERIFNPPSGSAFTPEEQALLSEVPGLAVNLNLLDDFLKSFDNLIDYQQITNEDLVKLQNRINKLRQVCVVVQTLDFKYAVALTGNFLNTDIRAQIQKLSKVLDPTKLLPTLKQINDSILSFIRLGRRIQNTINQAQFVIKILVLFVKVLRFIIKFFIALPLPSMFTTSGVQTALSDAHKTAKDTNNFIIRLLREINALLEVVLILVRYILANANELQIRLQQLILAIEACEAFKDSDIVKQLKETNDALTSMRVDLESYITQYDSKTNPDTAYFGKYSIRVVDEEVTDKSIPNKRRRGIALDQNGILVAQSDLTFATNTSVIIAEVKLQLMAQGLVSNLQQIQVEDLAVIAESMDYLNSNDILEDDLNLESRDSEDTPDNTDENKGLGLNAFINNLPGGKRLRKRVRKALDNATNTLGNQLASEKASSSSALSTGQTLATSVGGTEPDESENPPKPSGKRRKR